MTNDILQPSALNFSMVSNNDLLVELIATRQSDGTLINLTGAVIKWQLFQCGTRNPLITKSTTDGNITISDQNAALGRFRFQLDPEDTFGFVTGNYPHEAVITLSDGNVNTLNVGNKKVSYGIAYIRSELTEQG